MSESLAAELGISMQNRQLGLAPRSARARSRAPRPRTIPKQRPMAKASAGGGTGAAPAAPYGSDVLMSEDEEEDNDMPSSLLGSNAGEEEFLSLPSTPGGSEAGLTSPVTAVRHHLAPGSSSPSQSLQLLSTQNIFTPEEGNPMSAGSQGDEELAELLEPFAAGDFDEIDDFDEQAVAADLGRADFGADGGSGANDLFSDNDSVVGADSPNGELGRQAGLLRQSVEPTVGSQTLGSEVQGETGSRAAG